MIYYKNRTFQNTSVKELRPKVEAALKKEGFGILTEIDFQATMKKKLNKDYLPHLILGACSPEYADKVVCLEPQVSTLLPCNVTLRELENGDIEVAAMDPAVAMQMIENEEINTHAKELRDKLQSVLKAI
ncbi:MAG: DUF302 domain-containing protein [Flavobacteriaceae bacterium]